MRVATSGDLATSFTLARAYGNTKASITRLTREVSTQRHADIAGVLKGETRGLSDLSHRLALLDSYDRNVVEVGARFAAMQTALGALQDVAVDKGPALLAAAEQGGVALDSTLFDAEDILTRAIGALNANWAGEYMFAGATPSVPAVATPTALMAAIDPLLAGLTDADAVIAAVDGFFDAPAGGGGFTDLGISGDRDPGGPVQVSPGDAVRSVLTADAAAFRDILKGAVLGVIARRGAPGAGTAGTARLAAAAGTRFLAASHGVTGLRAQQGVLERQVELARARNGAERSALELARSDIVSADPYRAATALTQSQVNLELIYTLTARLSRLSLVNHL